MIYRMSSGDNCSYTVSTHDVDGVWVQINHNENTKKTHAYVTLKEHVLMVKIHFKQVDQWYAIKE